MTELDPLIAALQPEDERFLKLHGWEQPPPRDPLREIYDARNERLARINREAKTRFRAEMKKVALQVVAFLAVVGLGACMIIANADRSAPQPVPASAAASTPSWHDSCAVFADILNNSERLNWAVSNNQQVSLEANKQADAAYHKMGC